MCAFGRGAFLDTERPGFVDALAAGDSVDVLGAALGEVGRVGPEPTVVPSCRRRGRSCGCASCRCGASRSPDGGERVNDGLFIARFYPSGGADGRFRGSSRSRVSMIQSRAAGVRSSRLAGAPFCRRTSTFTLVEVIDRLLHLPPWRLRRLANSFGPVFARRRSTAPRANPGSGVPCDPSSRRTHSMFPGSWVGIGRIRRSGGQQTSFPSVAGFRPDNTQKASSGAALRFPMMGRWSFVFPSPPAWPIRPSACPRRGRLPGRR